MKYLKIEDNKGFFWNGTDYLEIDKIDKDSLLFLLNSAESDEFEIDKYDENLLGNKAHQIIYENLFLKFDHFLADKNQFLSEVETIYQEAIKKYEVESIDEIEEQELTDSEPEGDFEEDVSDDVPF